MQKTVRRERRLVSFKYGSKREGRGEMEGDGAHIISF